MKNIISVYIKPFKHLARYALLIIACFCVGVSLSGPAPGECPNKLVPKEVEYPYDYIFGCDSPITCGDVNGQPSCERIKQCKPNLKRCGSTLEENPKGCYYESCQFTYTRQRCRCLRKLGGCMCEGTTCQLPVVISGTLASGTDCP